MLKRTRLGWLALLLALSFLPLAGESTRYYLRNREVVGTVVGGDIYLAREQLARLLTPVELARLQWSAEGQLSIGESVAPSGPGISLSWLANQLGFSKRSNPGAVDWVKLPEPQVPGPGSDEAWRRRPEFREAGRRLRAIMTQLPPAGRPELQARVERIGQAVAKASPLRDMPWTFVVVKMEEPNAACTGEGHVFVSEGLLEMGLSDDELAGVLGHEIAHGVRRHVFRRSDLLRDITQLLRDYQRLQARLDQGESSLTLRQEVERYRRTRDQLQHQFDNDRFYSHVDEEEADVLGLRYSVTAGFSADGLGQCLQRLENLRVALFGAAVLSDDMSHPPTRRRLEILQRARKNAGF